jgi:A/G-specific adenine glycosylase
LKLEGDGVLHAPDQQALLEWYDTHQRDLPWRRTQDPWHILLSEVLLQQTQVSRGKVYWERMVQRFPTVESMAKAPVDAVLKAWEGAGYYSRARRLHALSQQVMLPSHEGGFDGALPSTYGALLSLPGIGPYTAAAVASIAFEQPVACVDGNIRRVMARITAQNEPTVREVKAWADDSLVSERAGDWNQALMELGATVCTPKRVKCGVCPLRTGCLGSDHPEAYPLPKRQRVKEVVLTAWVEWAQDGRPVLTQRPMDGLFAGLWGPAYHEGVRSPDTDHVHCGVVKHKLSHRKMTVHVLVSTTRTVESGVIAEEVALSTLDEKVLSLAKACIDADA